MPAGGQCIQIFALELIFAPLKIYNETPDGRLNRDLRETLAINELHLFSFKTPTKWALMSEGNVTIWAFSTQNGVKGKPP